MIWIDGMINFDMDIDRGLYVYRMINVDLDIDRGLFVDRHDKC